MRFFYKNKIPIFISLLFGIPFILFQNATIRNRVVDTGATEGKTYTSLLSRGNYERCDEFVYLDSGTFKYKDKQFQLKGVNFAMGFGALVTNSAKGKSTEFMLVQDASNEVTNTSYCRDQYHSPTCCATAEECLGRIEKTHIANLNALNITSVRLLLPEIQIATAPATDPYSPGQKYFFMSIGTVGDQWPYNNNVTLRLDIPTEEQIYLSMIHDAVRLLGAHGIRSVFLLSGNGMLLQQNPALARKISSDLAGELKTETDLIGYDLFNEPSWNVGTEGLPKNQVQAMAQSWVDPIRSVDQNHLITMGNGEIAASIFDWDPYVLPIDFNAYHTYPYGSPLLVVQGNESLPTSAWQKSQRPWLAQQSGWERQQAYASALGACGPVTCPFLGEFDGANCLVGNGPQYTEGVISGNHMLYTARPGRTCEADGAKVFSNGYCSVGTFNPQRDKAFVLNNFKNNSPYFYVEPTVCGNGKKPIIIGETGFPVEVRNPDGTFATTILPTALGNETVMDGLGNNADQNTFLLDVVSGIQSCLYQGLWWWQYADVHWGTDQDAFGLYTWYNQMSPGSKKFTTDLFIRPAGTTFSKSVDFIKTSSNKCTPTEPTPVVRSKGNFTAQLKRTHSKEASGTTYTYRGRILDAYNSPVSYAAVKIVDTNSWGYTVVYTDDQGNYSLKSSEIFQAAVASQFGYETSQTVYFSGENIPSINIHKIDPSTLPPYQPPNKRIRSCEKAYGTLSRIGNTNVEKSSTD